MCNGNEARERIQEVPIKYCFNILKLSTLALIAVIAGTDLQIVNDLVQYKENIHSLSNFTHENRNSEYALVHRDKAEVKKPTFFRLTIFGFGMGPEFPSDMAGDGPRKTIDDEDDYHPGQERNKRIKTYNLKRKRSKAARRADNLKQNPKRSKAARRADNLKQNPKRTKADRKA